MGSNVSSGNIKIKLSDKGIKDLESDVKNVHMLPTFSKLQEINLSKNKITEIPKSILADLAKSPNVVESLRELNLNKNRLSEIPEAVFRCYNIKILKIDDNELEIIPPRISTLYAMEELHISHNKIKRLPWNIHNLTYLRELYIDYNELTHLPNNLGRLQKLVAFSFTNNPIEDKDLVAKESLDDILKHVKNQKVPAIYKQDARDAYQREQAKIDVLTKDGQVVRSLLKFDEGLDALKEYCMKEHSLENLEFYLAIRTFKRTYNSELEITSNALIKHAKDIYDRFIAAESKEQVNIPSEAIEKLRKPFTDMFHFPKGINQWVFNQAYSATFDLLANDTFLRFKMTAKGKELLEQLEKHNRRRRPTAD